MNQPLKIFLAEDDADDRDLFSMFLKHRMDIGQITTAENGIELIDMLDKLPDTSLPNLVILDQNMPKMNGLVTLEHLKANPRFRRIPVIIYSTYASDILFEDCLQKGSLFVSEKPGNKEGYEKMIDRFLALAKK